MRFNVLRVKKYAAVTGVIALSIASWIIAFRHGLTTSYNDAMSHLDLARMVVDSQQSGIAQLGSVWLPLSQLLYLPLIWIGWAWHSGFAGSIVSMIAYVCTVVGIYRVTYEITGKKIAAYVSAFAIACNVNLLYLQATPLTEPVFLATFVWSVLYLIRYLKTRNMLFLALAAGFTSLQVADRYDGWFIAGIEFAILLYHEAIVRKQAARKVFGILCLFITPIIFTMLLWLAWNMLLYGDPLYSFIGPYSAHAQQATIQSHGGLPTKGNLWKSISFFVIDIRDNIGNFVSLVGALGWIVYLSFYGRKTWFTTAVFLLCVSDIIFNILALFFGFSVLNIPETKWNTATIASEYFNVRYGITALPFMAIGCGLIVQKSKKLAVLFGLLILLQAGVLLHSGLITVKDGSVGSSAFVDQDVADTLRKDVGKNQQVLISTSYYNAVIFRTGLDFRQFIYEGISQKWKAAIARPADYAQWIVMANGNVGDPVYSSLILKEKSAFLASYKLVFAGKHANIYERKSSDELYITKNGTKLTDGSTNFVVRGVNSYDLAYEDKTSIDASFRELQSIGVNTVRFWLFGDGNSEGFQPSAGVISEQRFETTDYIFAEAHRYHLRLIPTLVNNWEDYGGMDQYLTWVGLSANNHDDFYTNQEAVQLYENYINHVLSRYNSLSGTTYATDPAILAWDIANEPRSNDIPPVATWIDTIVHYTKSIDPNHLVTVSLDGSMLQNSEALLCKSSAIDFCSVHIYPQKQNDPTQDFTSLSQETKQLAIYKTTANHLQKPVIISEIGIPKDATPFGLAPLTVLSTSIQSANTLNYSGWLIWNWAQNPDTSFGFSPEGLQGIYTLSDLQHIVKPPLH